jgi:hypothetical protein
MQSIIYGRYKHCNSTSDIISTENYLRILSFLKLLLNFTIAYLFLAQMKAKFEENAT